LGRTGNRAYPLLIIFILLKRSLAHRSEIHGYLRMMMKDEDGRRATRCRVATAFLMKMKMKMKRETRGARWGAGGTMHEAGRRGFPPLA
jgi:hypothetical protein